MAAAALVIAILSAIGTIGATWFAHKSAVSAREAAGATVALQRIEEARRADEVAAQEQAARSQQEANLRLKLGVLMPGLGYLRVCNDGPADAFEVVPEPVGVFGPGNVPHIDGWEEPVTIFAGDHHDYSMTYVEGDGHGLECRVRWRDGMGLRAERLRAS